ncbi:hypothetical protein AAC03nite_24760 [Alicyclobacillus acidoterrestris]|nr:hypothetical protein AAC03nite_24760 [Alicyclobacillus acidoterrestris]
MFFFIPEADIIDTYFTPECKRALATAVVQAYRLVSSLDERILYGPESQGIGGILRRAATAAFVKEVIKLRKLPFHEYVVHTGPYDSPHLLMMSDDQKVAFSINQVKDLGKFPRRANYRDELITRNVRQPSMDLFGGDTADVFPEGWTYVMLTHGYGSLSPRFVALGVPLPNKKWASPVRNILSEASAEMMVPEETIEKTIKPALKKGLIIERGNEA